jgi:3-oxoacyl-[acyl-carrier-protein] synthase II
VDQVSRRVVVTGVGLVCGLGIGTDEVWKNLLAGKSGVRSITHFDTANFDCTIAGEVRDFDPLHWAEKKELKKIARFIQLRAFYRCGNGIQTNPTHNQDLWYMEVHVFF